MWIITLIAVIGVLLADVAGAFAGSSVGGPMTMLLILVVAMLAVGLHEAWTHGRGVPGGILSIVCALVGGVVAAMIGGMIMDTVIPMLHLNGPLARSQHPARYLSSAGMTLLTLLGSWGVLRLIGRFR